MEAREGDAAARAGRIASMDAMADPLADQLPSRRDSLQAFQRLGQCGLLAQHLVQMFEGHFIEERLAFRCKSHKYATSIFQGRLSFCKP